MFRKFCFSFPELIFNFAAFSGFLVLYIYFTLQTSFFIAEKLLPFQKVDYSSMHRRSQHKPTNQENKIRGYFAVHKWKNLCKGSLQTMYNSTVFPKYPDTIQLVNNSILSSRSDNLGRRISGYLNVPETGFYKFLLTSIGNSELWVSETDRNKDIKLIASVQLENTSTKERFRKRHQYSMEKFMDEKISHPIEIFHFGDFLDVRWIQPGKHEFEVIGDSHISHDTKSLTHEGLTSQFYKHEDFNEKAVFKFFLVAFVTQWVRDSAIPECSVGLKNEKKKKKISNFDLKTNVEVMFSDQHGDKMEAWKQIPEVRQLVEFYLEGMEKIYPKRFKPKRLYKVEKLPILLDNKALYLIELELEVDGLDYPERVVEYIHKQNTSHFCYPKGLACNKDAFINVVVAVNNETKWLRLFIDRLEKAFEEALEVDLHLVVVVFNVNLLEIEGILDKTSMKDRFTVTKMGGPFSKSRGLNRGVSLAKGNNSIILTCDVHVDIPNTIFEDARTHCIEGRMAFAPVVLQLDCSSHPGSQNPTGLWCLHGYDVIGIFKTDWTRISGMDETLFEQKGDWDLVNRMRNSGLSLARFKYPGLYRYYIPPKDRRLETEEEKEDGFLKRDV